jgi:quinoprotein dehydrogenase-associated probable ABC transporter substrate-binding protein
MRIRPIPVLLALAGMVGLASVLPAAPPPRRVLRVAADPNNLPFTNRKLEGFENKVAELLARELDAELQYSWRAQRRGFFRESFKGDECDVVLGVPAGFERALTTASYYRSTYVFVSRRNRGLKVRSFDDPALRTLKIGVQLIGDDGVNTPPAHALAARGIVNNVAGFTVYGDYAEENPPARIVAAVAKGEVDIAVVWGPLAAYFAREHGGLAIVPVEPQADASGLPMAFDIAVGVRKGNKALRDEIDAILVRRRDEIGRILDDFGVPRVPPQRATQERGGA